MPEKLERCVDHVMAQGKPESSAWPICKSSLGETEASYVGKNYCPQCGDSFWDPAKLEQHKRYHNTVPDEMGCNCPMTREVQETIDKIKGHRSLSQIIDAT